MVELTTQLLILENILWLPLCRINKFGLNALPSKAVAIPYTCGLSPYHRSLRASTTRISFTWLSYDYGLFTTCHIMPILPLHVILAFMPFPCNCDPCLHLPMIHHYATPMCICLLGGDPSSDCHDFFVSLLLMLVVLGES